MGMELVCIVLLRILRTSSKQKAGNSIELPAFFIANYPIQKGRSLPSSIELAASNVCTLAAGAGLAT